MPAAMRWASPSTMAVLPTPGSPTSAGLFLVILHSTSIIARISRSRPMTGAKLPLAGQRGQVAAVLVEVGRGPRAAVGALARRRAAQGRARRRDRQLPQALGRAAPPRGGLDPRLPEQGRDGRRPGQAIEHADQQVQRAGLGVATLAHQRPGAANGRHGARRGLDARGRPCPGSSRPPSRALSPAPDSAPSGKGRSGAVRKSPSSRCSRPSSSWRSTRAAVWAASMAAWAGGEKSVNMVIGPVDWGSDVPAWEHVALYRSPLGTVNADLGASAQLPARGRVA